MADFIYFTAKAVYRALVSDSGDEGGEPDFAVITGNVVFTPTVSVVASQTLTPATIAILNPFTGRIVEDGVEGDKYGILKTIDEEPLYYLDELGERTDTETETPVYGVRLPANSEALSLADLAYKVEFTQMKWGGERKHLDSFYFAAPTEDTEIDLATVQRIVAP